MPSQPMPSLALTELDDDFSILRFHDLSPLLNELLEVGASFLSVTRTGTELSVIVPTQLADRSSAPPQAERSDDWRCLRVETSTYPSETPGIVASVVGPLAQAGISAFAVASFDTDHVLVQDIEGACSVLKNAGHDVARHVGSGGSTSAEIRFREPTEDDSASLSLLADAATRRLISWLWTHSAGVGQSGFELGRETIRSNAASLSHFARWRVADCDGRLAGGLNSYLLQPAEDLAQPPEVAQVLRPLTELKAIAEGTWYVSVASVFPEFRNRGVGQALLAEAEVMARTAGVGKMTLLVGSFNVGAHRLYQRVGFCEWERRAFVPFPGSDEGGDWILMVKELT